MAIDTGKLQEFLGRFVTDLGATFAAGNVVTGHRLGLYRALADAPASAAGTRPADADQPAVRDRVAARPGGRRVRRVRLRDGNVLDDRGTGVRAGQPGRRGLRPGAFVLALGTLKAEPRITEAFRTGGGMGWHEHDEDVFTGCEAFFRPGYIANLIPSWIPALDGVEARLRAGAAVADIGCGLGASTVLLAQEYPNSRFTGSDYHEQSVEIARKRAADAGVGDRVRFEVRRQPTASPAPATTWSATFDCLHDMGDPLAAARHVRQALHRTAPG